jgi:amino acid transporter
MNNPQRDVPRSILIGIPIITFLYLFVTVGQLVTGQRDVYAFFNHIVVQSGGAIDGIAAKTLNVIVGCVIMISLFGSINAFVLTSIRSLQSAIDEEIIIGAVKFKKLANGRHLRAGALYGAFIGTIVSGIMAIPIVVLNSDSAYDGVSNLPTLFFFMIYALIILFGLINHYTHKVEVKRMKIFPIVAIIAILGCAFAFGYNLFYEFTARNFIDDKQVS